MKEIYSTMRRITVGEPRSKSCVNRTTDSRDFAEGYIKKGVQQGLRPEFAIWCGLHEDDPREKEKQSWTFKPNWYKHSPMYYVDEVFTSQYSQLRLLWNEKLIADGKVKKTEHGTVLVENQDEKGRVDCGREPDGARQQGEAVKA